MGRSLVAVAPLLLWACVPSERSEHGQPDRPARPAPADAVPPVRSESAEVPSDEAEAGQAAALPLLRATFKDDFERTELGTDYLATSPAYRIERGKLCVQGARNHPLWLRYRLPLNARIELSVESRSAEGDIKLEVWGDGRSAATGNSYDDASSYLAIFGGWKNRYHVLARKDEHARGRAEVAILPGSDDPREAPVVLDRVYRMKVERSDGQTVRFWVDDVELLSLKDAAPLSGPGHEHLGFNDWETPVCFDDLSIEPLAS